MRNVLPFWSLVRNYTAIASAFIYNLNIFGLSAKNICAPGFNCHGCPWATFSCPVGVIGYGFGIRSIPAFALGSVLAIGIVLGRLICGYACPFGLLQELLFRIKTRKFSLPRRLRYLKYIILVLTVFLLTYIFGFEPTTGYLRVRKPVVAEDVPELDQTLFAEKNRGYFVHDKYATKVTAGGFPVPEGLADGANDTGLQPIGLGGESVGGGAFSLEELALEAEEPVTDIKNSKAEAVAEGLSPVGLGGGIGDLGDLTGDLSPSAVNSEEAAGGESVFDFLERSKDEAYADTELLVEVTVDNMSEQPLDQFVLTPVYYENGTGEELWRGEDKIYTEHLEPGDSYTTEIFTVPYYLHKADIVILSAQTAVELDYWNLFCTYCPVAAVEADVPSKLSGVESYSQLISAISSINSLRLILTIVVLFLSVIISRFFCRTLCPLGAMYGLLARFAIVRVVLDKNKCIGCGKCDTVCPAELDVRKEVGTGECLACGDCVKVCPVSALKRKAGL